MRKWIVTALFLAVLIVGGVYARSWWPWLHDRLTRKDTVDFLTSLGGIAAVLTLFGAMAVWLFRLWRPEKEAKKAEDPPPTIPAPPPTVHIIHSAVVPAENPIALPLHQLPTPPGDFTGRVEELSELLTKVKIGGVAISGVHGMGGVGKTALALKLAEKLKADYPDAQLYLDLKGVSERPVTPKEAMAHVIRAWHPTAQLPDDEGQLGAYYRSLLDGKRVLLLLDNARDAAQVQPLLPPAGCLLLVTSRQRFTLPGIEQKNLDTLTPAEARDFLLKVAPRLRGEKPDEIDDLARLCGYLPLELRAVGSALQTRVDLTLADYLRRLQEKGKRRLLAETDTSRQLSTEDILLSSYELLGKELQRRFRFLAVFPETFDFLAAAAVWEAEEGDAKDSLGELLTYSLVDFEEASQRYRLHDLVRLFAGQKLSENEDEKARAGRRHSLHYLKALALADQLYLKGGESVTKGLALFDVEWGNIRAGQAWAASQAAGDDGAAEACYRYPHAGANWLLLRQPPRERIRWLEAALASAQRLKTQEWEGAALSNLGIAYRGLGQYRTAIEHLEKALIIERKTKDRRGEGRVLGNLGLAYRGLGEYGTAIEYHEKGLTIARETGDHHFEGMALGNLGAANYSLGEYRRALEYYEQDLTIAHEIGDRRGESAALRGLGVTHLSLGEHRRAIEYDEKSLTIAREIGDREGEGDALWTSALAFKELGDRAEAIARAEAALKILEAIESPYAQGVRDKLAVWQEEKGKSAGQNT